MWMKSLFTATSSDYTKKDDDEQQRLLTGDLTSEPTTLLAVNTSSNMIMSEDSDVVGDATSIMEEVKVDGDEDELRVLIYTTCYNVIDGVTLTIRKIENEILNQGGKVCIVTTRSGSPKNTDLVYEWMMNDVSSNDNKNSKLLSDYYSAHRQIIFIDNAIQIPFQADPTQPDTMYYVGTNLPKTVIDQIEEFDPTLIHITVPDVCNMEVIQYARFRQIPLMGTYHSNYVDYLDHYGLFFLKPWLVGFFQHQYSFLQSLYCPTPFMQKQLSKEDICYNKCTNLQVWGRGTDLDKFSPLHRSQEFRSYYNFSQDDVVICFVGRLIGEKRPDIFANVIRRLHAQGIQNFKALVVGVGPYGAEMKELPNTVCTGWLSGDDLAVAYASADIFLFPSALETFGNVTAEAAASGLPLVVEAGCSGHLVDDGVNGFACAEGDENSFFQATLTLVQEHAMRRAFSQNSRKLSYKYEKRLVLQQMVSNYRQVTEEFYTKYNGNHYNRDRMNPEVRDYRVMGDVEKPLLLKLIIHGFIFVATTMFWLLPFITFILERIPKFGGNKSMHHQNNYKKNIEEIESLVVEAASTVVSKSSSSSSSSSSLSSQLISSEGTSAQPWKGCGCVYQCSNYSSKFIFWFVRRQAQIEYLVRMCFHRTVQGCLNLTTSRRRKNTDPVVEMIGVQGGLNAV